MQIKTKYHGEIKIKEEEILHFEKGIPGFLEEKEFIILPLSENNNPFFIMQSVLTEYLAFVISSPFDFFPDYHFELEDSIVEELKLITEKDIQVLSILTVADPFEKSTANLQAPIIINTVNQQAKQVILNNSSYHTKHEIFKKG